MLSATLLIAFLCLIFGPFVKGIFFEYHGHRILLLAVAGLTGMYMVHLLAEDYNTYQANNRPPPKGLFGKRSIPDDVFGLVKKKISRAVVEQVRDALTKPKYDFSNEMSRLDMILRLDPTGCARRYVCTVATKSSKKMTRSEQNVMNLMRAVAKIGKKSPGQIAFKRAMELGKSKKDPNACASEYPKCIFSVSQMLRLMNLF